MAGSKRKSWLPLHSNSSPVRSIRKMNPIPQSQTPPIPPSATDITAPSTDVVDQPIPALSAVSGLEDNNDPPESPILGPRRLQKYKVPSGFFHLSARYARNTYLCLLLVLFQAFLFNFEKRCVPVESLVKHPLHPKIPQSQTPPPPPENTTATSIGLVADQPITATSEVNGAQDDTDNPVQSPASGLNAPRRRRGNGTALDPKSVGVVFCEKKGKKEEEEKEGEKEGIWESNLWFPGVRIPGRSKLGLQIFLGSYLTKEEAQDVHDRTALKLFHTKGVAPNLNFHESRHAEFMKEHEDWNLWDFVWQFRRHCPCFTKGKSSLKGVTVTEDAKGSLFKAKIAFTYKGEKKVFYELGKFESEEEAGRAYDRALLFLRHEETEAEKLTVVPNFRPSRYSKSEILRAGKINNIRKPILPESLE